MKRFLIRYHLEVGPAEEWHRRVAEFIAALDADPELKGRIHYRCMKTREGADYFHLADSVDDAATKTLQSREYFKRYTEETKRIAGGAVTVSPLETFAMSEHAP